MKKIIFGLLLVVAVTPLWAQVPPGPHWNLDKFMYIYKGVMVDSNIYPAINHKRSLGLPTGIDVGPRWWRALYVDSIFTNYINVVVSGSGLNRFQIMDSLAKYALSGYRDTTIYKNGVFAGDSHYVGGVRNVVLGGRGDTISDGAMWTDSTRNCGILAGEYNSIIGGTASTVTGGQYNWNWAAMSAIDGGRWNFITPFDSDCVILGGISNMVYSGFMGGITTQSGILAGDTNMINEGDADVICGGGLNVIGYNAPAHYSGIFAGYGDSIDGDWSTIIGGMGNYIASRAGFCGIDGGVWNSIGSSSGYSNIVGGEGNLVDEQGSGIYSGYADTITLGVTNGILASNWSRIENSWASVIEGGIENVILGTGQMSSMENQISGGYGDTIVDSWDGAICAGESNRLDTTDNAFIGGGAYNRIRIGEGDAIVGGAYDTISSSNPADYSFIGAGQNNFIGDDHASIIGGWYNRIENSSGLSVIAGGSSNEILGSGNCGIFAGMSDSIYGVGPGTCNVILGGYENKIEGYQTVDAAIVGGLNNYVAASGAVVVAGWLDSVTSDFSLIYGSYNKISDPNSNNNFAGGEHSAVNGASGHDDNIALGNGGLVDTCMSSFAFNTRVYKRDSVLAVCKQIWVRGVSSEDTAIMHGKGLYGMKIVSAKTDSFAGKVSFQNQSRFAQSIPGITAADVVVATLELNDSDSLMVALISGWCKADSIIYESWTFDVTLGTYKHKSITDVVQYHVVRKTPGSIPW